MYATRTYFFRVQARKSCTHQIYLTCKDKFQWCRCQDVDRESSTFMLFFIITINALAACATPIINGYCARLIRNVIHQLREGRSRGFGEN